MNNIKMSKLVGFIFLTSMTLTGCSTPGTENPVVITYDEWPIDGFPNDAAEVNQISLEGDNLTIDVTYQGGCQQHTFELVAWSAFLESLPPQVTLYLSHNAHGDNCTEETNLKLTFDLSPLDQERKDPSEHPLILRIYAPIGGSFSNELVIPLIEWP